MLDQVIGLSHRLTRLSVWGGGALLIAAACLVSFDVIARKFFGFAIRGSDELTSYAFAISTSWALAYTLLERYHIRIDAIYMKLPRRACALLDIASLLSFAGFMTFLTYRSGIVLKTTVEFGSHANTPLQTPLVIPQALWFLGLVLFVVVIALLLLRAVIAFVLGDNASVRALAGVRTPEEEVEAEVAGQVGVR